MTPAHDTTAARESDAGREAQIAPPDRTLDITKEVCPMTFVRTRLALDAMMPGQIVHVRLRGEEPLRNVSRSTEALGHVILDRLVEPGGAVTLIIRKA